MMTREEAYKKLCKLPVGHTMDYIALVPTKNLIDQIFDQQDKLETERDKYNTIAANLQISRQKAYDNIAELEARIQNMCAECECAKFADSAIKPYMALHSLTDDKHGS